MHTEIYKDGNSKKPVYFHDGSGRKVSREKYNKLLIKVLRKIDKDFEKNYYKWLTEMGKENDKNII